MKLDFSDKTPIYLQIADLIRNAILTKAIVENEPIPSVRQLAVDYGINHQTILKATQILINEGIIEKKRGQGLFVTVGAVNTLQKLTLKSFIEKETPTFIDRAKSLNMNKSEIIEIINKQFEE